MSKWTEYLSYGWQLCELRPGTKMPRDTGWQNQLRNVFNEAALGAGLVHQWSGTCALDVDDYEKGKAWLAERGIDLDALFAADDSVQILSGRSNHGKLLFALPEALKSKKVIEAKKNIIDFRCIGNQDVLPPSIHPDTGKPYRWVGDPVMGLPPLPAALEALWRSLLTPAAEVPADGPTQAGEPELAELLASRDPDCDYLEWLKVGMAVHAATNGQGFYIWDNWAKRGDKYNVPADGSGLVGVAHLMSKWKSFRADGGLGVGSLRAEKVAAPSDFPTEPTVADEFAEAVAATPYEQSRRLLADRMVYLSTQGKFWLKPSEPRIAGLDEHLDLAVSHMNLDDYFLGSMPKVIAPNGRVTRMKPLDFWRTELPLTEQQRVNNIGFHPGEGKIFTDDGISYLNAFKSYPTDTVRPTAQQFETWQKLMNRLQDTNYERWVMQYFAHAFQRPGIKIKTAPLLCGQPGTGKGTLMSVVPKLIFGTANVEPMSNAVLNSDFNDILLNTWFVTFEELKTDGGKQDRITLSNKVKEWITEDYINIHPKGLKAYKIRNRVQFTATTNFDDAMHLEDNDRRWAVCEMAGDNMNDEDAADLFEGFLKLPDAAARLRWLFSEGNTSLVGFSPTGKPPRTAARATMVRASFGTWTARLLEKIMNGEPPFHRDAVTGAAVRDALMGQNSPSIFRIGSVLKQANIPAMKVHTVRGDVYVWRNTESWRGRGNALLHHLDSGDRPYGPPWTDEIPLAIRRIAGDDGDPNDITDLLGD